MRNNVIITIQGHTLTDVEVVSRALFASLSNEYGIETIWSPKGVDGNLVEGIYRIPLKGVVEIQNKFSGNASKAFSGSRCRLALVSCSSHSINNQKRGLAKLPVSDIANVLANYYALAPEQT